MADICFYAAVSGPALFEIVEFYRQDVDALRAHGHTVVPVNRPAGLRRDFDLYWVWWQTSGAPAILAAHLRRVPSVLVTALSWNDPTTSGMQSKSIAAKVAAGVSLRLADLVLATSDDTLDGIRHHRAGGARKLVLGVDTGAYAPVPGGCKRPLVVTISHLTADNVERKRILDVVRIARHVCADAAVDFVIAGTLGDAAARVRAEIDRLGVADRVTLAGRISREEKLRLLGEAMVYLQPTRYEAFGLAIAEAMACGLPVVSNAVGSVPEVVGSAGVVCAPDADAIAIAGELAALLRDDERRSRLGAEARRRVLAEFSLEDRTAAVGGVVSELLARR